MMTSRSCVRRRTTSWRNSSATASAASWSTSSRVRSTNCARRSTPPRRLPFLTERRVVVARDVGRFNADDLTLAARLSRQSARDDRTRPGGWWRPVVEEAHRRCEGRRRQRRQHEPSESAPGSPDLGAVRRPRSTASGSTVRRRRGSPISWATMWAVSKASCP